jgi:PAS domain S-box-containing protein
MLSDHHLIEILSQSSDACAVYDSGELHIRFVNDAMLQLWGKNKNVLGRTFPEALPELEEQPFTNLLQQVWHSGETYTATDEPATIEIEGELKTSYFDFIYRPLLDAAGNTFAILHTAKDVSSRMQAWQQVAITNNGMQAANESLSQLNQRHWNQRMILSV